METTWWWERWRENGQTTVTQIATLYNCCEQRSIRMNYTFYHLPQQRPFQVPLLPRTGMMVRSEFSISAELEVFTCAGLDQHYTISHAWVGSCLISVCVDRLVIVKGSTVLAIFIILQQNCKTGITEKLAVVFELSWGMDDMHHRQAQGEMV